MTSSSSRLRRRVTGAALLLALLVAGPPTAGADAPPAAVVAAVCARIGADWSVAPERVQLEWGVVRSFEGIGPATPLRLVGRGVEGWFTAVFEPAGAPQVAVRVRAGVMCAVDVAARPLAAGTRLAAEDVRQVPEVLWGPPLEAPARAMPGWEVRRALMTGEALRAPAVAPPLMVAAGEPVTFEWLQGGVRVSVTGTALHAARLGETVRARVEARGERLAGVVTGPGTATMQGGIR